MSAVVARGNERPTAPELAGDGGLEGEAMTDLVERLRDIAHASRLEWPADDVNAMNEAADELERLRAELGEANNLGNQFSDEVVRMRERAERAEAALANPLLTGMNIGNGTMDIGLEGAGPQLIAGMFLGTFEKYPDAKNYIEVRFDSPQGPLLVTVVKPGGKTPHQARRETEAERDALRKELDRLAEVSQQQAEPQRSGITAEQVAQLKRLADEYAARWCSWITAHQPGTTDHDDAHNALHAALDALHTEGEE